MDVDYRISGLKEMMMKAAAFIVYGTNLLLQLFTDWLGVGLFLSPLFMTLAYGVFALWFAISGVAIIDSQKIRTLLISWAISAIPVVNLFYFSIGKSGIPRPGIVNTISSVIDQSKQEDEVKAEGEAENLMVRYQEEGFRENYRSGPSTRYEDDDDEYEEAA